MAIKIKPKIRYDNLYKKYIKTTYKIYVPTKMSFIKVEHESIEEEVLKEIFNAQRKIGNEIQIIEYTTTI